MGTRGRESAAHIAVIGPKGSRPYVVQRNSPHAGMQHILAELALLLRLAHGAGEVLTALRGRPRRRRILISRDASSSLSQDAISALRPSRMASGLRSASSSTRATSAGEKINQRRASRALGLGKGP